MSAWKQNSIKSFNRPEKIVSIVPSIIVWCSIKYWKLRFKFFFVLKTASCCVKILITKHCIWKMFWSVSKWPFNVVWLTNCVNLSLTKNRQQKNHNNNWVNRLHNLYIDRCSMNIRHQSLYVCFFLCVV